MGLILDSSVVIDAERRGEPVAGLVERVLRTTGDLHAALTSVGVVELVHGIYRARTRGVRTRRETYVNDVLAVLTVHPFTRETAMLAGRLDGEQQAKGIIIPFGDLLIGATALSLGYSVFTANARHFERIPGLSVQRF